MLRSAVSTLFTPSPIFLHLARELGVSAYVFEEGFDFKNALFRSVVAEGLRDHLDFQDSKKTFTYSSGYASSALSSPPSSPTPSLPPSPKPPATTEPPHPEPSNAPITNSQKRKCERWKKSSKRNHKKRRIEAPPKAAADIRIRTNPAERFAAGGSSFLSSFSMQDAPAASTAYVGLRDVGVEGGGRTWQLRELVGPGAADEFQLIKCEAGTTVPFADAEGRVYGLVVYPNDPGVRKCAEEAARLIQSERSNCSFSAEQLEHRRGSFPALTTGVAHGNGRTHPQNIVHNVANTSVLKRLTSSKPFQCLSGFATGVFKTWAPRLYNYCEEHLTDLLSSDGLLTRIFDNSVLPAAAFNFGPRTVCLPHVDFGNLPFNLCWIWALGWYNWKKGGHMILWDLKIVVEFPPGSLMAIPSGVCCHSNTCIGRSEIRYSFTQYAPGGNFHWVDHGFQSEEDFQAGLTTAEKKEEKLTKKARWEMGLGLFSTLTELGLNNELS
ncbi:hypothetical protein F5051DRAFT_433918 [Lentinula edodes]|nr:hypothetical protein F5051DRAFT_433918 [Lentinula edodes]